MPLRAFLAGLGRLIQLWPEPVQGYPHKDEAAALRADGERLFGPLLQDTAPPFPHESQRVTPAARAAGDV